MIITFFSQNQLNTLSSSYRKALKDEFSDYQNDLGNPFYGLQVIYALLNLSADEVSLNKLDEDMSPNEYLQYGIEPFQSELIAHYEHQGATWEVNPFGLKTLIIPPHSVPFKILKEKTVGFSQDQRRFALNLLHLFLEKGTISKDILLTELQVV